MRLLHFREKLAHFNFNVEQVADKDHLIADTLSCSPFLCPPEYEMIAVNAAFANNVTADPALQAFHNAARSDDD